MPDSQQETLTKPIRVTGSRGTNAKVIGAVVLGLLGMVLLVATKTTAGAALICSALILILPVDRLTKRRRPSIWISTAVILVLCTIATLSISRTDIVPDQERTGFIFADQVMAILQRFMENIGVKSVWTQSSQRIQEFQSESHFGVFRVATIPEPSTLALAALGIIALAAARWRRKRSLAE